MQISENSRIWIYQANRVFTHDEEKVIQQKMDDFTAQWLAHGNQLAAKGEIRYHQFLILSVDEQFAGATGCSIDKSVNLMKELEQQYNINLFDRFRIAYRDGEEIINCDREEFENLIRDGKLNSETLVFNNTITSRKELQTGWILPLKNSWHAQVFGNLLPA
ncbi:MAG: ABC transporter ATPase [Daejeonella sp.]